jgi:hypothetical protein
MLPSKGVAVISGRTERSGATCHAAVATYPERSARRIVPLTQSVGDNSRLRANGLRSTSKMTAVDHRPDNHLNCMRHHQDQTVGIITESKAGKSPNCFWRPWPELHAPRSS